MNCRVSSTCGRDLVTVLTRYWQRSFGASALHKNGSVAALCGLVLMALLGACNTSARMAGGTPPPTELIGAWVAGTMTDIIDVDGNGNPAGDRSGTGLFYKFNPDGSFGYGFSENVSNVGCTTVYFVYKAGVLEVNGSSLVLHPRSGRATYKDSCNPHTNTDKTLSGNQLQPDPYTWQIVPSETDPHVPNLRLTAPGGASGTLRPPG